MLGEQAIDPLVRELATPDSFEVGLVCLLVEFQTLEHLGGDLTGDDDGSRGVSHDQIAGDNDDAAAADRVVDLAGAAVEWTDRGRSPGEDGEIERFDRGEVADQTVDDEAADP